MEERTQEIISYYQNQPYQTQAKRTYDMLIEIIALEVLPDKKTFTEAELGELLQIGRTPLREALKLLEFDSIIKTIPRLGIQVQACRIEDYFLQAEARTALERVVTRRASLLATDVSRDKLKQLNESFEITSKNGDRLALYRIDRSIHELIDECSENPYAVHALEPLRFFEQRVHYLLSRVYPEIGDTLNREHIAYVNAIIEGHEEAAYTHFENMITSTTKLVQLRVEANMGMPF